VLVFRTGGQTIRIQVQENDKHHKLWDEKKSAGEKKKRKRAHYQRGRKTQETARPAKPSKPELDRQMRHASNLKNGFFYKKKGNAF